MMKEVLLKDKDYFVEHFVRLGVVGKVQTLAIAPEREDSTTDNEIHSIESGDDVAASLEDAQEISSNRAYRWKDWCLVRGRDCLYIWCDSCALEFSNGSNGWFRFMLDGRLSTMYSSGSPESGSDNADNRAEFTEKLQRARLIVKTGTPTSPILSVNGPKAVAIGAWVLISPNAGELHIRNVECTVQRTILREGGTGFVFESNRDTRHTFSAETTLGPEFNTNWLGRKGKRLASRAELQRQRVKTSASDLFETYFQKTKEKPRPVVVQLQQSIGSLLKSVETTAIDYNLFEKSLVGLKKLIKDEHALSTYELYSSGLVSALLTIIPKLNSDFRLYTIFSKLFARKENDAQVSDPLPMLVRKLIACLESVEKLPQWFYEVPSSSFGFQLLTRRFRLRFEKAAHESALIDRSGRCLKAEPLATVGQLKQYLSKMVAKQWYDYERSSFEFVKYFKEKKGEPLIFTYQYDFDDNGVLYWLGTNGRTSKEWINPAQYNVAQVTSSDRVLPYGKPEGKNLFVCLLELSAKIVPLFFRRYS